MCRLYTIITILYYESIVWYFEAFISEAFIHGKLRHLSDRIMAKPQISLYSRRTAQSWRSSWVYLIAQHVYCVFTVHWVCWRYSWSDFSCNLPCQRAMKAKAETMNVHQVSSGISSPTRSGISSSSSFKALYPHEWNWRCWRIGGAEPKSIIIKINQSASFMTLPEHKRISI